MADKRIASRVLCTALVLSSSGFVQSAPAETVAYRFSGDLAIQACNVTALLCIPATRIEGEFAYSTDRDTIGTPISDPIGAGEYFNFKIISLLPNGAPFELVADQSDYPIESSRTSIELDIGASAVVDRFTYHITEVGRGSPFRIEVLTDNLGVEGVDDGQVPVPTILVPLIAPNPVTVTVTLPVGSLYGDQYVFNRVQLTAVPLPASLPMLSAALSGVLVLSRRALRSRS